MILPVGVRAFLSLGSNMGDTAKNIRDALQIIATLPDITIGKTSKIYLTEPQSVTTQEYFANAVVECICEETVKPQKFLEKILEIESTLGRNRVGAIPSGPRLIDIDLLLVGDCVLHTPTLILPHARMFERAFVLVPLYEIAPDLVFPNQKTVGQALQEISYSVAHSVIYQPGR